MITHYLILQTIYNARQSLRNVKEFSVPWAVGIQNVLPIGVLNELNNYFDSYQERKAEPQGQIQNMETDDCGGSGLVPRKSLIWEPETVLEEIHQTFDLLSDSVGILWNKKLRLHSVNFWEDQPGFTMSQHIDSDSSVVLQVYLNDNVQSAGTEFFDENHQLLDRVPWEKNSGYTLNCVPNSWHGVTTPSLQTRRSLYAIYQDAQK